MRVLCIALNDALINVEHVLNEAKPVLFGRARDTDYNSMHIPTELIELLNIILWCLE